MNDVMKTEINGFEIKDYNQYNLKDEAKYSPCPLCSSGRSASHQKTKCASLDWNRGLGTCHHCGEVFQLHTYGNKAKPKSWYAQQTLPDGRNKYFNDDGTETIR